MEIVNYKLKFIGTAGAFSKKYTNNSAYINIKNHLILFDCGETVFHEMLKLDIINEKVKRIDIIITHFHSDHVGSLGSLLFYCRFKKVKIVNIIFPLKKIVNKFLNIIGINENMYNILKPNELNYYLKEYKQPHGDLDKNGNLIKMPSYGYHINYKNYNLFYSGDTNVINKKILKMFNNKKINYLYHEVTNDGYKAHVQLENLEKEIEVKDRNRVFCMHLSDSIDIEQLKKIGFNSAR